jgi:hypothetical protein
MSVACVAGEFSILALSIAVQGTLTLVLRPSSLIALAIDTAVLIAGFIGAFFLFRPLVHRLRWPPYVLGVASGAAVVVSFRFTFPIVIRVLIRLPVSVVPYRVAAFLIIMTTSFLICLATLFLYRLTVDRARLRESPSSGEPEEPR